MVLGAVFLILGVASANMALDSDKEGSSELGRTDRHNGMSEERNMDMRMAWAEGDLDGDGINNSEDPDDDSDGIIDTEDEYPRDHDNDGIPDHKDIDDDNDGIVDTEDDEYVGNCPKPPRKFGDLDSDGIADCEDPDDDADGINDTLDEYPHDHDNDGIPDHKDDDDDNDDIPDNEDDEYVGNCSGPEQKFGFKKFRPKNQDGHDMERRMRKK